MGEGRRREGRNKGETNMLARKEGRKEGGKEGRKEGRKENREEEKRKKGRRKEATEGREEGMEERGEGGEKERRSFVCNFITKDSTDGLLGLFTNILHCFFSPYHFL